MGAAAGAVGAADVPFGDAMRDHGSSAAVASLVEEASRPPSSRSTREWLAIVAHCQEVVNVATAAQDAAIARLAAVERELDEDGTVVDVPRALGHLALDAPDVLSGVLPISHTHAESRVRLAIRCAADVPGAESLGASTGLGGLHEAMAAGVLDGYCASIVADELEDAPAEVASAVVLALEPHLATDEPAVLRQRCRRVLGRISPDLLRQRATRARERCGLRRWAHEPGVDRWDGTFPSEEAAVAWAAIDALAQRYVADGVCAPIGRARAKALTDLVAGRATIEVTVGLTVPEGDVRNEGEPAPTGSEPPAGSETPTGSETPAGAEAPAGAKARAGSETPTGTGAPAGTETPTGSKTPAGCEAPTGTGTPAASEAPAGSGATAGTPDAAADSRDNSGVRDEAHGGDRSAAGEDAPAPAAAASSASDPARLTGSAFLPARSAAADAAPEHDDLLEVGGLLPGDPVLVSGAWLRRMLREARAAQQDRASRRRRGRSSGRTPPTVSLRPCDADTGALLDLPDVVERAYRPSARLAAFVRARDRRCRFPGCSVAARFCDLDHVRPWPTGPTSAANLMCVCRRHHRIKQRPGWRVRLARDGTVSWVDPADVVRVTRAVDALHALRLPADRSSDGEGPEHARPSVPAPAREAGTVRTGGPVEETVGAPAGPGARTCGHWSRLPQDGPHSAVEFVLEHTVVGPWTDVTVATVRRLRRQGTDIELLPAPLPAAWNPTGRAHRQRRTPRSGQQDPGPWSARRRGQRDDEQPPF
ncbi:hypothetical protein [Fodinibacter luteus]|uniref:hypothetical protein n=1 Tax=Fodinibacter luteus TaxID=552064 RepID=UPI0031E8CCF0